MDRNWEEILSHFNVKDTVSTFGDGHINDTYVTSSGKYIVQRVNNNVFKHPRRVMSNIAVITAHIREKTAEEGGNPDRATLTIIKTTDGKNYYQTEDGGFYRLSLNIKDTVTLQSIEKPEYFYNAAKAFGKFQRMLSDFPAETLYETIKNFHNTVSRYDDLMEAVENNLSGRAGDVAAELDFIKERQDYAHVVLDAMEEGAIPVRVTHNDTKLNNVLLDKETKEGVAVIDLDTVMPGSLLYDYGDSMRYGTNTGAEDDPDLDNVSCDLELFESYTKGFMEEMGPYMTEREIELLPFSSILLTYECGMRFLTDHINGDTYFKIHRPNHNLDRARAQFKLVYDMEQKIDKMKEIVAKYTK